MTVLVTELSRDVHAVLAQVQQGSQVIIEQEDHEAIAIISAPHRSGRPIVDILREARERGSTLHFTPEQQAQLDQIATNAGTVPEHLVTTLITRYLNEESRFQAAVERSIAAAERGEFIEEEMDARLEAMFNL